MIIQSKNNRQVLFRNLSSADFDQLYHYLHNLSAETNSRFGPHPFDRDSIAAFYNNSADRLGYVAIDMETNDLIAYSIIKIGFLEHDRTRLESYGLLLDNQKDCTFAPSVADAWQGCGIGKHLFYFILADLKSKAISRIILWGGVQANNERAVVYYCKLGFKTLGQFQYNGENYDMSFDIE